MERTQVAIVGAGPAGMLLSELLHRRGVASIVVEKHRRAHVLARIRAGVLEQTTVDVLREAGLAGRLEREGGVHDGMRIVWMGRDGDFTIDTAHHCGKRFTVYGQTQIQQDLYEAADARGAIVLDGCADVAIEGIDGARPVVRFTRDGRSRSIECEFVAGCDGFHGISRRAIPHGVLREFEKVYPFGWLGVLSATRALPDITYAHSPRGFALASHRHPMLSRYYIQVGLGERVEDWSDAAFWAELKQRFPRELAEAIETGPALEKSIAPLRSYVAEPMRWGRLFLAGDAAHIVPPTGAKGLNLAVSDVWYLARAIGTACASGDTTLLDAYSDTALRRVWSSVRTSWYLTMLLHRFPDATAFDLRAQEAELDHLKRSPAAQAALAEQYAGLPIEGGPDPP